MPRLPVVEEPPLAAFPARTLAAEGVELRRRQGEADFRREADQRAAEQRAAETVAAPVERWRQKRRTSSDVPTARLSNGWPITRTCRTSR